MTKTNLQQDAEILASELAGRTVEEIVDKLMFWNKEAQEFFNEQMKKEVPAGISALAIVSQA